MTRGFPLHDHTAGALSDAADSPGDPPAPLIAPAKAGELLDQVIYERILECVDLDALEGFSSTLAMLITNTHRDTSHVDYGDGSDGDDPMDKLTCQMIDRALIRLSEDLSCYVRYMRLGDPFDDNAPRERPGDRKPRARRARGSKAKD